MSLCLAAFTPLPNRLADMMGTAERLNPADAIVVLGGGLERDGRLSQASLPRVTRAVVLHRQRLASLVVFSGSHHPGQPAEADVSKRFARDLGVPAEQILTETGARTTREEAARIAALLKPRGARHILLVTDSWHLTRTTPLFRQAGFEVFPVPADVVSSASDGPEERLKLLRRVSQELIALLYYRIAGYL